MSYSGNAGCGCLGQIIFFVLVFTIGGIMDLYDNSQWGMIREARNNVDNVYYYRKYLNKYPQGKYVDEVYDSLISIYEKRSWDESIYEFISPDNSKSNLLANIAYDNAVRWNSIAIWENFIEQIHPNYIRDAQYKLDRLRDKANKKEAEKWGKESVAWETASNMDSYEGYLKYAELYPKGKHYNIVKKKIIDYEVARDFAGEHGEMPTMEKIGSGQGSYSNIEIENQTSYTLTILYSGEASERLSIPSHSSGRIKLPNGNYRISARVDASNVIPFVGSESLTGGSYSASYYISTSRY